MLPVVEKYGVDLKDFFDLGCASGRGIPHTPKIAPGVQTQGSDINQGKITHYRVLNDSGRSLRKTSQKETFMPSPVIKWISENVDGKTFADIGGIGLNSLNERVSTSVRGGAQAATMIDFRRFGFPEWNAFDKKMEELDVAKYNKIDGANLEASDFPEFVGQYDFVHCTGILYHAPAPMIMLDNLSRITKKYLIVNTVIVPETIETEVGSLQIPGSQILFLPGISEQEREILEVYYQKLLGWPPERFSSFAPRIHDEKSVMPWIQTRAASEQHIWSSKGALSYSPYWMLFTKQAFRAAVTMFGFKIKDEHSFKGHTLTLFCERA